MLAKFPSPASVGALMICANLLTACAVGPDYRAPTQQLPANFANANNKQLSAKDVEVSWWQSFHDAQLIHLVDQAIRHNYNLQAARANLAEARALYLESGLNLLPIVTAHGNYTEQKRSTAALNNRAFVPRELKLFNTGFDASWEVDFFGRVRRNVEASNDELEAQTADLRDVGISVIAEVARNYFELRGVKQELRIAKQNADNQAQTLEITQVKLANGRGTELDTARALAQLETTRASIPSLETAISHSIHRLSVLTGQLPDALTSALATAASLPKAPEILQIGNPAQLLQRRPDIRSAERSLAAATARIGVATADLFPRVSFVGSISLEANTLSAIAAPGSESYSLGPKISWAALDLGRVYARIKAADARAEANLAQYRQIVLNALEETENALVSYKQEKIRQTSLAGAVNASEKASQLARLRYEEGITDFLTVLDSEQRLLQNQSQLAQSQTATTTSLIAVYKALGGGWQVLSPLK